MKRHNAAALDDSDNSRFIVALAASTATYCCLSLLLLFRCHCFCYCCAVLQAAAQQTAGERGKSRTKESLSPIALHLFVLTIVLLQTLRVSHVLCMHD